MRTEKTHPQACAPGQDIEKDFGLPYASLDLIVYTHLQGGSPAKIATKTGGDINKVKGMWRASQS